MGLIRNFGDFHMFQLVPRDGVLVLGFAKAFTVKGFDFAIAAHISKA
jgi:putative heme iron utilization protein